MAKQSSSSSPLLGFTISTPLLGGKTHLFPSTCASSRPVSITVATASTPSPVVNDVAKPSRRSFAALLATVPLFSFLPSSSFADILSGQLSPYKDLPKGFTILRPNGWNEFEALQDNYDIKWQDVIQPLEFVTVLTSPVSKGKELSDIGSAKDVGSKLAKSRSGELVSADEKSIDGIPAYVFEIKRDKSRQITLLSVNKMKLYSVNASCSERRWSKREKLLRSVVDSFKPKL